MEIENFTERFLAFAKKQSGEYYPGDPDNCALAQFVHSVHPDAVPLNYGWSSAEFIREHANDTGLNAQTQFLYPAECRSKISNWTGSTLGATWAALVTRIEEAIHAKA